MPYSTCAWGWLESERSKQDSLDDPPETDLSFEDTLVLPDTHVHEPFVCVPADQLADEDRDLVKEIPLDGPEDETPCGHVRSVCHSHLRWRID